MQDYRGFLCVIWGGGECIKPSWRTGEWFEVIWKEEASVTFNLLLHWKSFTCQCYVLMLICQRRSGHQRQVYRSDVWFVSTRLQINYLFAELYLFLLIFAGSIWTLSPPIPTQVVTSPSPRSSDTPITLTQVQHTHNVKTMSWNWNTVCKYCQTRYKCHKVHQGKGTNRDMTKKCQSTSYKFPQWPLQKPRSCLDDVMWPFALGISYRIIISCSYGTHCTHTTYFYSFIHVGLDCPFVFGRQCKCVGERFFLECKKHFPHTTILSGECESPASFVS